MAQHLAFGISVLLLAIASSYFIQQFFKSPVEHRSNSEKVAERTSWLCSGNVSTDRVCRFKNLCYSSRLDKFVAIGVSSTEEKSLMKSELGKALSLTSVVDMKYTCDIVSSPASAIQNGNCVVQIRLCISRRTSDEPTATWEHINNFTEHVRARLAIYPNCNGDDFGIIFRRKTNRIIVNEDEIIRAISEEFGLKIIATSLEENSLTDLIEKASCAKLMIGVHGALLMLMIFLQPQSVVLELFPYGIIPDYKSQYKTLASLPGSNIEYVRWRNMDETNTVTHPENERYFGGIAHLQKETQNKIIESSEVSPKKRLSHPEWRFRLYQDTIVDIPAITKLLGGTYLRKGMQTRKDQSRFFDLIGSVYVFTVRTVKQLMSKTSLNSQLNTNRKRALKTTVITYGN
ncbi:glycosyltransferase [Apostichopus japonicus]|uniref:Glycosyltransferase n=1 Tax=Stichopus japonicus TaxID=307972 RepID=A0A2G8JNE1_STIJA|nr:glycosyltransferase [Apostichopus japonicus]